MFILFEGKKIFAGGGGGGLQFGASVERQSHCCLLNILLRTVTILINQVRNYSCGCFLDSQYQFSALVRQSKYKFCVHLSFVL